MLVTELGIVRDDKILQLEKAVFPMLFNVFESVSDDNFKQLEKA